MKIIAKKDVLLNVIKKASKIANGRSSLPVYNHVALSTDGSLCTVTASDSIRTYQEKFECSGEPGDCTLEAVKLNRAITSMKAGEIEISKGAIKQGKTNIKLESLPYDHFPVPNFDTAKSTGMHSSELFGISSMIAHAMPTKDVRPMLNGVHLTSGNAVACDGHRMAFTECSYQGEDIIIPAETVRTMPDIEGDISVSSQQMIIKNDSMIYATSLVDAKYPDWKRIIPSSFEVELKVDKALFIEAIKTVQIGGDVVKLEITKEAMSILNDGAQTECHVSADGEILVGFMAQYLLDAASQCIESDLIIKLGQAKACMINDSFIVMPVRI